MSRNTSRGYCYENNWGSASEDPLGDSVEPLTGEETGVFFRQISSLDEDRSWTVNLQHFLPAHIQVKHPSGAREHPQAETHRRT